MFIYPLWIRLWHFANAVLIIILIITGISMHFAGNENSIHIVRFSRAVGWHNIAAKILTVSYIAFITGNIFTENGKYYRLKRKNFISNLGKQVRFYFYGMFKQEKNPFPVTFERKFNPLQKLAYVLIMYLAFPLLIISGVGLMLPEVFINKLFGINGLIITDILHITMGFLISLFLVIHIYSCTLGPRPTSLFRAIITGYRESDEDE
jgi:thiosulfate reductase cytochrome b subunit